MVDTQGDGSSWRLWLAGCALGCLGLVVLVVGSLVGTYLWVSAPGSQIETEAILGADSVGFVRLQNLAEDEGVTRLLVEGIRLASEHRRAEVDGEQIPFVFKWLFGLEESPERQMEEIREDFPRAVTATFEVVVPGQEPQLVLAANLARWPRFLRLSAAAVGFFRGVEMQGSLAFQSFDEAGNVAFVENTLIWTRHSDAMRVALDRVDDFGNKEASRSENSQAYARLASRWDLFGFVRNREELTRWAMSRQGAGDASSGPLRIQDFEASLKSLEVLRFGFDIVSENVLTGELLLELAEEADARGWNELVQTAIQQRQGVWERFHLSATQSGREVAVRIETGQLLEILSEALAGEME